MAHVLVTGAGGFVGRAVVRHLRATGTCVRAGTRGGAPVDDAPGVRLDVTDRASCDRAMDGIDSVVHCAVGAAAVTIGGTRTVLAAAGPRRVVHFSSIAVYGATPGAVTEDAALAPDLRGYGAWKQAAEAACGANVARLRPTIVYGPGATVFVETLLARIRAGRWGQFGIDADGLCNPVHVDDVARAACLALTADAGGQAFNIDAGTPMTWNVWFARIAALDGRTLPEYGPGRLRAWSRNALPVKALARLAPPLRPALARALLAPAGSECALYRLQATYPATRARSVLGWQPLVSLDAGMAGCIG